MKIKNVVILILLVVNVGLSLLLYRTTRISKTVEELALKVPQQVPVDIFVTGMTAAIQKHNQTCSELVSQVQWLRRHLEKTISVLENERNLEPIGVEIPLLKEKVPPSDYLMESEPFIVPYQKPEFKHPDKIEDESGLRALESMMNLNSVNALLATSNMEILIDNFYHRLERLGIEKADSNQP